MKPPEWVPPEVVVEAVRFYNDLCDGSPDRAERLARLICDDRMREIFEATAAFDEVRTIWRFVEAAWTSDWNYSSSRENLKRARELKREISGAAKKLADALNRFDSTRVGGPRELQHVLPLLQRVGGTDLIVLRAPRPGSSLNDLVFGSVEWWRVFHPTLPTLAELLGELSQLSFDYEPEEFGMPGAAITSRQTNPKNEFLRAFWHVLGGRGFERSTRLDHLISIVATVVLNDPRIAVLAADVRDALKE